MGRFLRSVKKRIVHRTSNSIINFKTTLGSPENLHCPILGQQYGINDERIPYSMMENDSPQGFAIPKVFQEASAEDWFVRGANQWCPPLPLLSQPASIPKRVSSVKSIPRLRLKLLAKITCYTTKAIHNLQLFSGNSYRIAKVAGLPFSRTRICSTTH